MLGFSPRFRWLQDAFGEVVTNISAHGMVMDLVSCGCFLRGDPGKIPSRLAPPPSESQLAFYLALF